MKKNEFLHDIINALTIADSSINKLHTKLNELPAHEIDVRFNIIKTELSKAFELLDKFKTSEDT